MALVDQIPKAFRPAILIVLGICFVAGAASGVIAWIDSRAEAAVERAPITAQILNVAKDTNEQVKAVREDSAFTRCALRVHMQGGPHEDAKLLDCEPLAK